MTIEEAVAQLKFEKENTISSRFPCRAIMVSTLTQYCSLLAKLKELDGIRVVSTDEIISSSDTLPQYKALTDATEQGEWVILTGASSYLFLLSKREQDEKSLSSLYHYIASVQNTGRIIIPLWGCQTQWNDESLGFMTDIRQEPFYFDCTDDSLVDQKFNLLVLSDKFEGFLDGFGDENSTVLVGMREWFEYWENPSPEGRDFILITKRHRYISAQSSDNIVVRVIRDPLSYLTDFMPGGAALSEDNCSPDMQNLLCPFAQQGITLDVALLKLLNVSAFSGADIMGKWSNMSEAERGFVALWLQLHPDDSYLRRCFASAESLADVTDHIVHDIFAYRLSKPAWVEEFKRLFTVMKLSPDEAYFKAVDEIPDYEERLSFVTSSTREERIYLLRMVGQWMRRDPAQVNSCEKLKASFPVLAAYLSGDLDVLKGEIGDYLSRYKAHKLENSLPDDEAAHFGNLDAGKYEKRYTLMADYDKACNAALWIDALGVEWLSLLCWSLKSDSNIKIKSIGIAQATLPTETCFNDQWNSMAIKHSKLDKLDKLAHKGVIDEPDYYACVVEQMDFVVSIAKKVSSLLDEHPCVVITGDHGTSRLAARFFHTREGIAPIAGATVCSHGRYCELPEKGIPESANIELVTSQDKRYAVFRNYDHFKQSGFAAGADDQNAIYGEVHGGASPEELLVPVIVVEGRHEIPLKGTWGFSGAVAMRRNRATFSISFNMPVDKLEVTVTKGNVELTKEGDGTKWNLVWSGIGAGSYEVKVTADGRIVNMPEVTIASQRGEDSRDSL